MHKLTRTHWLCLAAAVLLLSAAAWYVTRRRQLARTPTGGAEAADGADGGAGPRPDAFPLRRGARGRRVEQLQIWLNEQLTAKGAAPITVDGAFGPATAAAVATVQKQPLKTINQTFFDKRGIGSYPTALFPAQP